VIYSLVRIVSDTITAKFEQGIFRPLETVDLPEGEEVEMLLIPKKGPSIETSLRALDELARLPIESEDDGFSGADHDAVLYPKE